MADVLTKRQRSYCMSRNKGRDTSPELTVRKILFSMGLRYKTQSKLTGKPDIVFVTPRVIVFIDGCFWHYCPEHCQFPKSNIVFWEEKLSKNRARDRKVKKKLEKENWKVLRIWEHEVKQDPIAVAIKIAEALF